MAYAAAAAEDKACMFKPGHGGKARPDTKCHSSARTHTPTTRRRTTLWTSGSAPAASNIATTSVRPILQGKAIRTTVGARPERCVRVCMCVCVCLSACPKAYVGAKRHVTARQYIPALRPWPHRRVVAQKVEGTESETHVAPSPPSPDTHPQRQLSPIR